MNQYRKKLIEVALPLDAINRESAREKSIRHGHPSTLHLWWARRPLAACRAVLFGQLVDDPSAWPDRFPTEAEQDQERQRLFRILEELVKWENSNNATVLDAARLEIARSFARNRQADGESDHRDDEVLRTDVRPEVVRTYLAEVVPPVHDPFAGGGSIPLEAQRLGLRAIATDLNPVAVMICKALIEIPPKFAGRSPVGPVPQGEKQTGLGTKNWPGATGLAEDVRRYGAWMREEAWKRIGHLYPKVGVTADMATNRPELRQFVGQKLTVIAWLWARTVESPNPAFRGVHVPLVSNFFLSTKKAKEVWVEPVIEGRDYHFEIRTGRPDNPDRIRQGTKTGRGTFNCILSNAPIEPQYIRKEAQAGRMKTCPMAIVTDGNRRRIYLPPLDEMVTIAKSAEPQWFPEELVTTPSHDVDRLPMYGMIHWGDAFTRRQLVALTTFSDLVLEAREKVIADARTSGWGDDGRGLETGGTGATAYGDVIATYLGLGVSKVTDYNATLVSWSNSRDQAAHVFTKQALSMVWDFCEVNPFAEAAGDLFITLRGLGRVLASLDFGSTGIAFQWDATRPDSVDDIIITTDPPYYDNIGYADLSDYFYVWLRRACRVIFPKLFGTMLVPKSAELVATPYRHGGVDAAEDFFHRGMTNVMERIAQRTLPCMPVVIFYAFKQAEARNEGISSTGWETFLSSILSAGFSVNGTWPIRTERGARSISIGSNALAASIVLICRKRPVNAPTITRGDLRRTLKRELPEALKHLQKGNIAPVDMAQASIGPGMGIFSRHASIIEADGSAMSVRSALQLINEVVDEVRGEEEAEFDRETRFAVTWFETHGFQPGPFGDAETLAKARNVSVIGVENAGLLKSVAGKVQLMTRMELPEAWNPDEDRTLTVWECTQHLIKRLEEGGEAAAAELLTKIGSHAEPTRGLAYRLYTTCERRGWAEEARAYNGLVIAWPELERLASEMETSSAGQTAQQTGLFDSR